MMYIDIIGGGSLGLLHAVKLSKVCSQIDGTKERFKGVRLWTRTVEQARLIGREGLRLIQKDKAAIHVHNLDAYALHEACGVFSQTGTEASCVLLCVKQTHIDLPLLEQLKLFPRRENAPLLCYQNGINHMEILQQAWPHKYLVWAVTTEAARRVHDNEVIHHGFGSTWLGVTRGTEDCVHRVTSVKILCNFVKEVLIKAGFQIFLSNNIEHIIYQKLLVNVIINPLTAMLRVKNGQLLHNEACLTLMRNLFQEAAAVYRAAHIVMDKKKDWNKIVSVCRKTECNESSMLQDIEAGRQTECEAITGALIRLAERHKVATPLHRTMYHLILAASNFSCK